MNRYDLIDDERELEEAERREVKRLFAGLVWSVLFAAALAWLIWGAV